MGAVTRKKKARKAQKAIRKKVPKYSDLPDLSNDPYFVKKAEKAKALLLKSGLLKD